MHGVPEVGDRPEKAGISTDLEFCRFIIDSLPAAVLTVDSELRIKGFNPWAERITGYGKDEIIDKTLWRRVAKRALGYELSAQPGPEPGETGDSKQNRDPEQIHLDYSDSQIPSFEKFSKILATPKHFSCCEATPPLPSHPSQSSAQPDNPGPPYIVTYFS